MFSKKQRLNKALFENVFQAGDTTKTPYFLIKTKKNNLPFSRFAVSIPKKQIKSAVQRHFLKRRFLHALKGLYSEVDVDAKGSDVVFVLNKGVLDVEYKDLIETLKEHI